MKAEEIAKILGAEIIGNPMVSVSSVGYLRTAKPEQLAYCFLKDKERDLEAISETKAGVVICDSDLREELLDLSTNAALILSASPKYDFARIMREFFLVKRVAHVAAVTRGRNVDVHPTAVLCGDVVLGNDVVIRANAVVGAEGLDVGKSSSGELIIVPHISSVILEDEVDIGCNTTVQRGILRPTIIGKGTKIGPNCDIVHEVKIGRNCIITGMTLVAGATEIGDNTFIAPHSTIKNNIKIGKNVFVGIGSLVVKDVPDNVTVIGRPAVDIEVFKRRRKKLKGILDSDKRSH